MFVLGLAIAAIGMLTLLVNTWSLTRTCARIDRRLDQIHHTLYDILVVLDARLPK